MQQFTPSRIYVDHAARGFPLTRRVLDNLPGVPSEVIDDPSFLKWEMPLHEAKKTLLITKHRGQVVHACQGMGDYVCCNYLTVSFASNCHFECTYCILQDYLRNNPVITLFADVEEILGEIEKTLSRDAQKLYRLGTGELSDSLALDDLTGLSRDLIPFAARKNNLILELKTKSDRVDQLLELDHRGRTVLAFSVNPARFSEQEELKCAPVEARLQAARKASDRAYPVAFHLDPLLAFRGWKDEHSMLLRRIRSLFEPGELAWISLGSLRYTPGLKKTVAKRFPNSRILFEELYPSPDGKVRYFREIREELYLFVKNLIGEHFPEVPNYLCMETQTVWKKVYQFVPRDSGALESALSARFAI